MIIKPLEVLQGMGYLTAEGKKRFLITFFNNIGNKSIYNGPVGITEKRDAFFGRSDR